MQVSGGIRKYAGWIVPITKQSSSCFGGRQQQSRRGCQFWVFFFFFFLFFPFLNRAGEHQACFAAMEGGRPVGTDGYDYAYRMTVDDRYKRAAEGRVSLRKFVSAQALLQILKATWACLGALNGDPPNYELVTSCAFGGAAVLLGTLGSKGSSKLLKFYILVTILAVGLSLIPFASGHYVGKWRDNWEYLQVTGDYQRVLYYTLEGVVELAGVLLQLISVLIAFSLMKNVSLPKKRV